ncbi:hypothetical protein [Streptomyces sp. NBC_01198]|uniref:hypothetical protein n=1 Tax=Streptomyces sp. NBC_01198 TaxID=2903769 RepID=UPI002E0DB9C4|nr:hypothetical protein OG702_22030 [Streptomyces sp. NBC_01198]
MASTTLTPGPAVHGATVHDTIPEHPRHRIGNALHALRVFAVAAAEVVLLGKESY